MRFRLAFLFHLSFGLFIIFFSVGCERAPEQAGGQAAQEQAAPQDPQPGGTLTVALQDSGQSLDPHAVSDAASMHLIENLYSTLMQYTPDYGEVRPLLAEAVEVSDDGLRYTVTLRPAVFHSGNPVTAQAVIFSIQRIREQVVRAQQFAAVERMEAPDDRTVVLHLSRPLAPLLTFLAHPMNAIVDPAVVADNDGNLGRADGGSGPFRLVDWQQGQRLELARFDDYFEDGLPYLDTVIFQPMADETARTSALRGGQVGLILSVAAKDIDLLAGQDGVVLDTVPGTFWEYVGMNTRAAPFDDVRVRRAVATVLDREAMAKLVKFGHATPLHSGPIPPGHWAHLDEPVYPAPDPDAARALLADAGYPDGFSATLKVGSAFPYQVQAAQVVKQQLAAVGIDVTLQAQESAVFFQALGDGDFQMSLVGWVGFVDPDEYLHNLFHTGARWNQQGYSNAKVDDLLEQARAAVDRGERARLYAEAQRAIATDAPMAFLHVNDHTSALAADVRGYAAHPTATTRSLARTWLARPVP